MSGKKRIFISSVQKELAAERRALKDYIQGDPFLGRFFDCVPVRGSACLRSPGR